jgi:hypothetical protein
MNEGELAYLAGVLDTRAVVRTRLVGGSQSMLPYLAISTGDTQLLQWLGTITGMRVVATVRGYDKHRCLEHCDQAHEHITSVSGRWSVSGSRATIVLAATRTWIRFQAADWDRALDVGAAAPRKDRIVEKMVQLGWPLPGEWQQQHTTQTTHTTQEATP